MLVVALILFMEWKSRNTNFSGKIRTGNYSVVVENEFGCTAAIM